ncbi:S-adenosyl-L-methionine-dependent methyltransferase [Protomyces lactucae-debilis]|uniref:S-adenosyl-L-methionine-dependent methyltransferase n=1 Tax=Protomyces lactucae-debilis TaxID=2754530 RepID=A0A1Y2FF19_PROLT|nr:S-adenosyl-L-methionine-dependent methyltransferase [Protomyces lactucae-debilis]ORY82538.1 S-adenosyl-L-methionine-dependent methyltransferase [Protomyces lactucae-debilis]
MSRPEHIAPPEFFYNGTEAQKYTDNSRIQAIQAEMAIRAIDLLELPEGQPSFILDIGCGSGLSGEILEQEGHYWVGMDIAPSMLQVALNRDTEGDLLLADIGQGVPFRAGSFDGAISVSVLQWLCNADTATANPQARLQHFFTSLYASLKRGAKAVFQFYPESERSLNMITSSATKCGFGGGVIVDHPDSKKAKKYYLCLQVGGGTLTLPDAEIDPADLRKKKIKNRKKDMTHKEAILKKKELYRKRGKAGVPLDSKFTGRKRRIKF